MKQALTAHSRYRGIRGVQLTSICHPDQPHRAKGLCKACYYAAWCAANRERRAATKRTWWAVNREKMVAYRLANRERQAATRRAWHAANRERKAGTDRAWRAANPERPLAYNRQRRARKLGAIGSITSDQWTSIKAAYAWRCAYCGKKPASLTQDHVIPLSYGGSHTPANIVPACRACNSSKGDRPPTRLPAKRLLI